MKWAIYIAEYLKPFRLRINKYSGLYSVASYSGEGRGGGGSEILREVIIFHRIPLTPAL